MTAAPPPYPPVDGTQPCALDPEAWFPDPAHERHAARLCAPCPWQAECAAYGAHHRLQGVWGGTTHQQRERARPKTRPNTTRMPMNQSPRAQARVRAGLTQAQAADALGVPRSKFAAWESGATRPPAGREAAWRAWLHQLDQAGTGQGHFMTA